MRMRVAAKHLEPPCPLRLLPPAAAPTATALRILEKGGTGKERIAKMRAEAEAKRQAALSGQLVLEGEDEQKAASSARAQAAQRRPSREKQPPGIDWDLDEDEDDDEDDSDSEDDTPTPTAKGPPATLAQMATAKAACKVAGGVFKTEEENQASTRRSRCHVHGTTHSLPRARHHVYPAPRTACSCDTPEYKPSFRLPHRRLDKCMCS